MTTVDTFWAQFEHEEKKKCFFENVDLYFAQAIAEKESAEVKIFVAFLFKSAREGHLCCLVEKSRILPEPPGEFSEVIKKGSEDISLNLVSENGPLVRVGNLWYLHRNYVCEKRIILGLNSVRSEEGSFYSETMLEDSFLTSQQKKAVVTALNARLCFVCGGPGTGKTRTAIELISLFLKKTHKTAAICAPTGKATANIRPFLDTFKERCTISTLHALLQRPFLSYDLILVDEGSMVDAFLMQKLFSRLKNSTQLIIFGDPDQLPPVGAGNLFKDLVLKKHCKTAFLSECLRAELQEMVDLSEKIKTEQSDEIPLIPLPTYDQLIKEHFFEKDIDKLFAYFHSKRILTPQRRGFYGVDTLNQLFYRESVNRRLTNIPILIKVNDPERELYNGDFGILNEKEKVAYFENGKQHHLALLPAFEYGFVLSVHKSQGSEYENVFVLLPEGSEKFGKSMLYTAVTRARKKAVICGAHSTLTKILNHEDCRYSGFV